MPDFIANAGGVICAAMELRGATESQAFATIAEKNRANVATVLADARDRREAPREAAVRLATARVREAMRYVRFGVM